MRRLQIMGGFEAAHAEVRFADFVPVNKLEAVQYEQIKTGMEIESKQTAAEELGLHWEKEMERMQAEKSAVDNVGAMLLNAFNRTGVG